jgi:hypothetical protein
MRSANIHIDKIRITAEWTHQPTGKTHYFDEDEFGSLPSGSARKNQKALVDGGEKAYIKSKGIDQHGVAHLVEIHCCPPLVLQKHNLFGHCILQDYVYPILNLAAKRLGLDVDPVQRAEWQRGGVSITEIHLTANFGCPRTAVLPIIDAIDANYAEGKSRIVPTSITVHGAKLRRSKSHALTVYDKHIELAAAFRSENRGRKPGAFQSKLLEKASKDIRVDIKLFSEELKYLDLGYVIRWKNVNVTELYFRFLKKYRLSHPIQRLLTADELNVLTKAERNAYQLWLAGHDLIDQFSRTTAWKYAKLLFAKTGIDVKGKRRPDALPAFDTSGIFTPENVLPVPRWAIGTRFFHSPAEMGPRRGISTVPVFPMDDD